MKKLIILFLLFIASAVCAFDYPVEGVDSRRTIYGKFSGGIVERMETSVYDSNADGIINDAAVPDTIARTDAFMETSVYDSNGNGILNDAAIPASIARESTVEGLSLIVDTKVTKIDTIADLRTHTGYTGESVQVLGYYTPGDGGGGPLRIWKEGAAPGFYPNNGGSSIWPDGGDGSSAWVSNKNSRVDSRSFGVTIGVGNDSVNSLALQAISDSWEALGAAELYIGGFTETIFVSSRTLFTADNVKILLDADITSTATLKAKTGIFTFTKIADGGDPISASDPIYNPSIIGLRQSTLDSNGQNVTDFSGDPGYFLYDTVHFNNCISPTIENLTLKNGLVTNLILNASQYGTVRHCFAYDSVTDNNFTIGFEIPPINTTEVIDESRWARHLIDDCHSYGADGFAFTILKSHNNIIRSCTSNGDNIGFGAEEILGHDLPLLGTNTFLNCTASQTVQKPFNFTTSNVDLINCHSLSPTTVIADLSEADGAKIKFGNGFQIAVGGNIRLISCVAKDAPNKGIHLDGTVGTVEILNCQETGSGFGGLYLNKANRVIVDGLSLDGDISAIRSVFTFNRTPEYIFSNIVAVGDMSIKWFALARLTDIVITDGSLTLQEGVSAVLKSVDVIAEDGFEGGLRGIQAQTTVDSCLISECTSEIGTLAPIENSATVREGQTTNQLHGETGTVSGDTNNNFRSKGFQSSSVSVSGNFQDNSMVWNTSSTLSGNPVGWFVNVQGTAKTISGAVVIVATTTAGDTSFTVDTLANIVTGNFVSVSGEPNPYEIFRIDSTSKILYTDRALSGDRNGSTIDFFAPTLVPLPNYP